MMVLLCILRKASKSWEELLTTLYYMDLKALTFGSVGKPQKSGS